MSLRSILLTALIFLGVTYWLRARDLKQLALSKATNHCKELDLALLDESVVLKKISLMRNIKGRLVLSRAYQFDFTSNGEDRYQGSIILAGRQVLQIKLPPHRID
tara:strand:+ start:4815 stop:5129 length:315 start_codon:yes stop_codon:yes gene_type:complete